MKKVFMDPEMEIVAILRGDVTTASAYATAPGFGCGDLENCPNFDPNGDIDDDETGNIR